MPQPAHPSMPTIYSRILAIWRCFPLLFPQACFVTDLISPSLRTCKVGADLSPGRETCPIMPKVICRTQEMLLSHPESPINFCRSLAGTEGLLAMWLALWDMEPICSQQGAPGAAAPAHAHAPGRVETHHQPECSHFPTQKPSYGPVWNKIKTGPSPLIFDVCFSLTSLHYPQLDSKASQFYNDKVIKN